MVFGFSRGWRWAAVAAAGLWCAPAAHGFYFRGWPGGPPDPPTLLPADPITGAEPPGFVRDPIPDAPPPGGGPGDEGPNPSTPEPGTAALAALGLGVVALARWRRRSA